MNDKKVFIENFVKKVKERYTDLIIGYEYDDENDVFDIWHTDKDYELFDEEFSSYTGELIRDILFANGIFNISFGYDYLKTKDISWECNSNSQNNIQITKGEIKVSVEKEDSIPKIFINKIITIEPEDIIYSVMDFTRIDFLEKDYLPLLEYSSDEKLDKYTQVNGEELIPAA